MPTPRPAKRPPPDEHDARISPPPPRMKRKTTATTTQAAVAQFFVPASQRAKDPTVWEERTPAVGQPTSLLVARYTPPDGSEDESSAGKSSANVSNGTEDKHKIAVFDLDSTLIMTASGKKHADGPGDWAWWDANVPQRLRALHEKGFHIAIISNQGGLRLHPENTKTAKMKTTTTTSTATKQPHKDRVIAFKKKCSAVLAALALAAPVWLYAACGHDRFRKPRTGLWDELLADLDISDVAVDRVASFFVGDAAGRPARDALKKDFSCSDRNFAANAKLIFHTPEEFFHGAERQPFVRDFDPAEFPRKEDEVDPDQQIDVPSSPELVVFCGPPGAGKSTFYARHLAPHGYRRVNQDTLKTKDRCINAAVAALKEGCPVAIDNTNPDVVTRALWIALATRHGVPARCIWFRTSPAVCAHNDAVRALNPEMNPEGRTALPRIAFNGFSSRFRAPTTNEGFAEVIEVPFRFRGTEVEYSIWGQYWL